MATWGEDETTGVAVGALVEVAASVRVEMVVGAVVGVLVGMLVGVLVGAMLVAASGAAFWTVAALPLPQFPTNSVTVVSDPPPPDLPGQFSEATWLQGNPLDPSPAWRWP